MNNYFFTQYSTFYAGILFQGYIQKIHSTTQATVTFTRAPLHSLTDERHGQGVLGNLQPFRQKKGSEKNGPNRKILYFFSVKPLANPHKIRFIQKVDLIGALYKRRAVSSESMLLAGIGLRILVEAIANDLKYKRINCNLKLQK